MESASSSLLKRKWNLFIGISLVLMNRALLRLKLRRRVDGWRRGAGLVLRRESATFVLSTFGLDVWSDVQTRPTPDIEATQSHLGERLAQFLAGETESHICIRRGEHEDSSQACPGPSYTLAFEPWIEGPARFLRPDHWAGNDHSPWRKRTATVNNEPDSRIDVLFNFIGRVHSDGSADLWVRVNHIGADGVPVQEMLSRLEAAWGFLREVEYPTPESFALHAGPRPSPGRDGLAEVQAFIDLSRLLAWRKQQNAGLPEPMTISAAILWCLARHEAFGTLHMGTTVEVQATDGLERGVGVVVVRPRDYFQRPQGMADYVRNFNRQLDLTRRRQSESCKTLDAAALIPPNLATALLHHALEQGTRAFGGLALTILKDAKVFGAPMGDAGHEHGFLALGSAMLRAADGRRVACITVKGPAARIADYPRLLNEALDQISSL